MPIFELEREGITNLQPITFAEAGIREREDLQRLLRANINIVAPDTLVISEEFSEWQDSSRRIDLLAVDQSARLVVIELKRDEVGAHMELQALRYAAMASALTFSRAVEFYHRYLERMDSQLDAEQSLLEFLGWDEPDEEQFGRKVRIVLASADFSKEITTTVLWLNSEHEMDIRCARIKPYRFLERILIDVQQVLPLPEASEFQIQLKEKSRAERVARETERDFTKYDVTAEGRTQLRLPKRRAAFTVIYALCNSGASPAQVQQTIGWRTMNSLWRIVDGEVDSGEFELQAAVNAQAGGPAFEPRRWFFDEDELICWEGRTYALTKMWGARTEEAIAALLAAFPGRTIQIEKSGDTAL
jgi:hypothetical protein